jgi:superfamily II DNA or RNA helicase
LLNTMLIQIINSIWAKLITGDKRILSHTMSYPTYIYRKVMDEEKGYRVKKRCEFFQSVIDKEGKFLTGFVPRLQTFCNDAGIPLDIRDENIYPTWYKDFPDLPQNLKQERRALLESHGIRLRPDQLEMIRAANLKGRGVIHSPTGSGKTVLMLATLLYHHSLNVLILVPNTDLVRQGISNFEPFFPKGIVGYITGTEIEPGRITFANIQKLYRVSTSKWHEDLDAVFVDECHHLTKFKGSYAKVLKSIPAPLRLGFTATLPYDPESIMALEGLLGPVIGSVSIQDLVDKEVLAKPIIKIRKVPYNHKIHELDNFVKVYTEGVINNRIRNRMILQEAKELVGQGLTVLILVTKLEHGENLERMSQVMFPELKLRYIHGVTHKNVREEVKETITRKDLDVVISSVIWKEGINIPSLGCVINAAGGKFEIFPQQALGRGLRIASGKKEVILVDYFDPSHSYLIDHFGHRFCLYMELGWI